MNETSNAKIWRIGNDNQTKPTNVDDFSVYVYFVEDFCAAQGNGSKAKSNRKQNRKFSAEFLLSQLEKRRSDETMKREVKNMK